MADKRDYYEVLGLAQGAGTDEIRKAYKQLALKYHPDRNPGDAAAEAKFKEATEAYQVLSDDEKRARYDQFGHEGVDGAMGGGNAADIFSHFQDLFGELFGGFAGGRSQRGPRRGADVRVQERLTLKEAVTGTKREVVVRAPSPCDSCNGSGAEKGTSRKNCGTCAGSGQVSTSRGFVMFTQPCPRCRGVGTVVETPCTACKGAGEVDKTKRVIVSFPPGIDGNQRLRVPGQGIAGPSGAPPGDLYVDVELEPDPRWERDQLDLVTKISLSYAAASLGTEVELELLDDTTFEVEVPPGTQPGAVLSFKGKGAPRVDGRGRGQLHVVVEVKVPKKLSARAKQLLKELDDELEDAAGAGKRAAP